jgi:cytidine deaminase
MASEEELIAAAREVRQNAMAIFSGFKVGAAVLGEDGKVYTGCNVESASYGLTICAERSAISAAISAGNRKITQIAIAGGGNKPTMPCGACRQWIWEFGDNVSLILIDEGKHIVRKKISELLPEAFDRKQLEEK